ncbi:MAG: glutamate 5-kinase [Planctomycetes bacterium]|nr:glutamate 5-kinase [Planctomycetota bacterium]
MDPRARDLFARARRLVVKAGTRVLLDADGRLDLNSIRRLLEELAGLCAGGRQVIFVTSGAIGAGLAPLGFAARPTAIPELQAAAAVGQSLLMQAYNGFLAPLGYTVAQVLLTHEDLEDRHRYLHVRNALTALTGRRVLPVINENDAVSVEEIRTGDNDLLSAMVANLVGADALVLLSDVAALCTADPTRDPNARPIPVVEQVTPEIEAMAQGSTSGMGKGGMASKVRAAKAVTAAGGALFLTHGKRSTLTAVVEGRAEGTLFLPAPDPLNHRQRWIVHTLRPAGELVVDAGGARALRAGGKSLLAVGIVEVRGEFAVGDAVLIRDDAGAPVAQGLANYAAADVRTIRGRRTGEIAELLGVRTYDEVVHRDNLVLLQDAATKTRSP